jgi:hypothetical protein
MLDGSTKPLPPDPKKISSESDCIEEQLKNQKQKKRKPPQLAPTELVVRGNLFTKNEMSKNSERNIYEHRLYAFFIPTQR